MENLHVYNLESPRSNRPVANQFVIEGRIECSGADDGYQVRIFQSYRTVIARMTWLPEGQTVELDTNWDYSVTTGKYRNIFLNESKKDTQAKIKSGEYIVTDLN